MLINLFLLAAWLLPGHAAAPRGELTIKTLTGTFTGLVNPDYPNVREFRSIPYAQPPLGSRRWAPPVALPPSGRHYFSYRYPPACQQYLTKNNTVWNSNLTADFIIPMYGQSTRAGAAAQSSSEDCLNLAIWTPLNISSEDRLPVAIYIPGGSWTNGGMPITYQQPVPFVSRRNEFIAVSLSYRVNIFGFPNAAGLDEQNLGVLDQRMAIEWVYANIAKFGGDPERMILWGQSAGAGAVDFHNYAYRDNPIVRGLYMMSGTAAAPSIALDVGNTNFTFVAKGVGCDFASDPVAELNCMRQVPANLITNFVGQYAENGTKPGMDFRLVQDERYYFKNYSDRAAKKLWAGLPALVSTTSNEYTSLYKYPENIATGPNMTDVDLYTTLVFACSASNTTDWRARAGLTTYRYQYAGNFSSVTPLWWMGAYHAADIPMVFGTYNRRSTAGDMERRVSETMQDYVFAFIVDPENGLRNKGWLPQTARASEGGNIMQFAVGNTVARNASSLVVDQYCLGTGPYERAPV